MARKINIVTSEGCQKNKKELDELKEKYDKANIISRLFIGIKLRKALDYELECILRKK